MIESARGIILRTQPLTETSLIVRWLTQDSGRLSTVAKGARRPKSPFAGRLDLFIEADLTFSRNPRSELHSLREVSVTDLHLALRNDVDRLQSAAYCSTLLEQTTETDTPLPGLFALFTGWLTHLSLDTARPRWIFAFELKLLDALGLAPSPDRTHLQPAAQGLLVALIREDWPAIQKLHPPPATVRELNAFLRGFLTYHLGAIPKTRGEALRLVSR
ncbi:MAG: DNA repair protein RecO [Verrucomicrobia bacterium]|jgi:DNA repair protein RecO (recombination protein O)|nr:DNA repair protein RecO [Verrucomicrobiota bacterium]